MKRATLCIAFAAVALWVQPEAALAGDRELEVMLINMTPDPVSDEGRACAAGIRRAIRADYTHINAMGETALREAVGDADGDFMGWQPASFSGLRERNRNTFVDAFVLFDCRPEARTFRALIVPASEGTARLEVNDVAMDRAFYRWAAARMLAHGWVGFSP